MASLARNHFGIRFGKFQKLSGPGTPLTAKPYLNFLLLLSLSVSLSSGLSAPRPRRPTSASSAVRISGQEYLRLSEWARANDLVVRWLKREESLLVSNSSVKLLLEVDSNDLQFNGVEVKLLFPLAYRDGIAYLAQLDAQTTLRPLLSPPRNRPGDLIRSVCLDPGHGGKEPGNHVGANLEKKYNLLLAEEVGQQLTRAGLKVFLTRTTDKTVDLPDRPAFAQRRNADLFVSLHFNAAPTSASTVKGAEVYCLTPAGAASTNARGEGATTQTYPGNRANDKNMFLAYQVQKALIRNLGVEDRGVHRARFAVLRDATMPAVLIEAGFMSHPVEGRKIFDPAYRREMARAIAEGIMNYKRVVGGHS